MEVLWFGYMEEVNINHIPGKTRNIHGIFVTHIMQGDLETFILFIILKLVKDR